MDREVQKAELRSYQDCISGCQWLWWVDLEHLASYEKKFWCIIWWWHAKGYRYGHLQQPQSTSRTWEIRNEICIVFWLPEVGHVDCYEACPKPPSCWVKVQWTCIIILLPQDTQTQLLASVAYHVCSLCPASSCGAVIPVSSPYWICCGPYCACGGPYWNCCGGACCR